MVFDSNVIGLAHNVYNSNIYVLTETSFVNRPFMALEPDMNYSQDYVMNLPSRPI